MENTIVFSCWSSEKKQTFLYVYSHAIICAQHSKNIFLEEGGRKRFGICFLLFLSSFFKWVLSFREDDFVPLSVVKYVEIIK